MSRRLAAVLVCALALPACSTRLVEVRPLGDVRLQVPAQTSVVVAADGAVLAELHAEQDRDLVSLADVPPLLRAAVVAVEDARFYEHAGVDARAVARAVVANSREGRVAQGGSTITQQLAKNAVVGTEQTLQRKLEEASVALQLEAQYSKDEILERYLNTVYFGHGAYGVQAAAERYFGVSVAALDLPQAALLAGLLKAPATYDPYAHPDVARARRNHVLDLLAEQGRADDEAVRAARAAPLVLAPQAEAQRWQAPYFVDHVLDSLQHDPAFAALGADPVARADRLFTGGLRIETTLDPAWQAAAEQAVAETLPAPDDPRAAVVALDPATGGIRVLVGGRDYYSPTDPQARFNLATDGRRQPGSVFKQLVLATALAQGHTLDETFPGGAQVTIPAQASHPEWAVENYAGTDFGALTLREATAFSVNVAYARLMAEVGPDAVAETARAAGITTPLQPYLSLALGAQEVTPLDVAAVQATLASGGVYRPPSAVVRITGPDGEVLYERGEPEGTRVLDEAVAWLTTTALQGVVEYGTGVRAAIGRPLAGKTGTTTAGADAWFAGYTPHLAAAVWIGFPEGRVAMTPPRTRIRVEGGNWPAELFARFALRALAGVPADDFAPPDLAVETVRVDVTRNCLPNPYTPPELIAERAYLAGTAPTELCTEPVGPAVEVPDAVGLPLDAARRLLHNAGFAVVERPEFSVQLPPGYVVRQAAADATVTLWVSTSERGAAAVPDVLELPVDAARARLEAAGFVVEVVVACPDGGVDCTGGRARPSRVWEQTPDAGAEVPAHSAVRLSVYPDV
jgi:membrane peptidoglycan carboxypeptidase